MRQYIATLGLLLSTAGCANGGPVKVYAVYLPDYLPAAMRQDFLDAAAEWEDEVPTAIDIRNTPCPMDNHCADVLLGTTAWMHGDYGLTWRANGPQADTITIATDISPAAMYQSVLHELGHLQGLQHIGPGNVMCWAHGCASSKLQSGDIAEWYRVH